jgi:hypothetical protein
MAFGFFKGTVSGLLGPRNPHLVEIGTLQNRLETSVSFEDKRESLLRLTELARAYQHVCWLCSSFVSSFDFYLEMECDACGKIFQNWLNDVMVSCA